MSTNESPAIKKFFRTICWLCVAFLAAIQLCYKLTAGVFSLWLLLVSLLFSASILACIRQYFKRQQRMLDDATTQLDRFSAGDVQARLESVDEGGFARLFHAVNQLATMLSAKAQQEQQEKTFLKNTIADVSHQLKTPLAALEIYNTLLRDECEDPASVAGFVDKQEKELTRIETLVQSLLKITKLDSGSVVLNRQRENISDMLQEIATHFAVRAEMEQKQLVVSGPDSAELFCDRAWFIEAVSNLVKNALDHTKEGDRIDVIWKELPAVTQIAVKDTGCGIHPEDIFYIFKRFYRSRFSKDTQGLGLGLPLAKAIVEAHDGAIEVDSVPGRGSTFTMAFLQNCKREFIKE